MGRRGENIDVIWGSHMAIKDWQSLLRTDGRLLTCLFENPGHDLVSMLRSGKSEYYIKRHIIENISFNCS